MDKIHIKNLKIAGKHGVYDFEKKQNRFFEIDAVICLSLKKAGESDNLKDTIDYVEVVNLITEIFKEMKFNLDVFFIANIHGNQTTFTICH